MRTELGSNHWQADISSGLMVALVGMPQCLAYALVAGLPPAYGLVTAAIPGLVAALFGKSHQVVTGPTNTTGLLVLAALTPFLGANGLVAAEYLPALALLTLMVGALRIAFAVFGGAAIVRFLPESVLVGFLAGAGVLIAVMQLDEALGLPAVTGSGLWAELAGISQELSRGHHVSQIAITLTGFSTLAILLGQRYCPRIPIALLWVGLAAGGAWALGLDQQLGLSLVADRSPIPLGWPAFALPALDPTLARAFLFPALAIALLGTLELMVTARAGGARPAMGREIMAQGAANLAGAFCGAFPASASLTRSTLLVLGGASSRMAAATAAVTVVPILFLFPQSVGFIPQAVLAGVLWATAWSMIDWRRIRRMWLASKQTRLLLGVTFGSTLLLPLEWAIVVGVGLALLLHLAGTMIPRIRVLVPQNGTLVPSSEHEGPMPEVVLEVSGDVHFAAAATLTDDILALLPQEAKLVVVDLSHAHQLRFAALEAFEALERILGARGRELVLAGVSAEFAKLVAQTGSTLALQRASAVPGRSAQRAVELH